VSRDEDLPLFATRKRLADQITQSRFPVSDRTLERWPVPRKYVNGHSVLDTAKTLEHADAMITKAPTVATGRAGLRRGARRIGRTG
jgi:hypothetical protein